MPQSFLFIRGFYLSTGSFKEKWIKIVITCLSAGTWKIWTPKPPVVLGLSPVHFSYHLCSLFSNCSRFSSLSLPYHNKVDLCWVALRMRDRYPSVINSGIWILVSSQIYQIIGFGIYPQFLRKFKSHFLSWKSAVFLGFWNNQNW
jgi:hypothetical protein